MTDQEPVVLLEDERTGDRFLVYGTDKGVLLDIRYEAETLWMTQPQIADEDLPADKIELEVKRGHAIVAAADQILRHATLQVQAAKIVSDHGMDPTAHLSVLNKNTTRVIEGR